jgi:hypothetical protein
MEGTLRCPNSLHEASKICIEASKPSEHFTAHGLRRTSSDLARRTKDPPDHDHLADRAAARVLQLSGPDENRIALTAVSDLAMKQGSPARSAEPDEPGQVGGGPKKKKADFRRRKSA